MKKEYTDVKLKMTRRKLIALDKKDIGKWTHQECVEADRLIQNTAIRNLRKKLSFFQGGTGRLVSNYAILMAQFHYGSAETDDFLTAMGCYEDWMFSEEQNKKRHSKKS